MRKLKAIYKILTSSNYYLFACKPDGTYYQDSKNMTFNHCYEVIDNLEDAIDLTAQDETLNYYNNILRNGIHPN